MIEVEKNFQPTEEQLAKMLADSEFVSKKINHDVYYDFSDDRLFRSYVKFRSRNGKFELKIKNQTGENENADAEVEIDDEAEIKKYFSTEKSIKEFVDTEMVLWSDYKNERTEYRNGEFTIDIDKLDFGYEMVEIEVLVEDKIQIKDAEDRIINFAKKYDFEIKYVASKGWKYFEIMEPERYKTLYLKQ